MHIHCSWDSLERGDLKDECAFEVCTLHGRVFQIDQMVSHKKITSDQASACPWKENKKIEVSKEETGWQNSL